MSAYPRRFAKTTGEVIRTWLAVLQSSVTVLIALRVFEVV